VCLATLIARPTDFQQRNNLVKNAPGNSVTEARIVEAAVQLFSRHGYKGASTRDISNLAKVNEVTLFRYFPRKTELFWAAVESRLSRVRMGRELQSKLAGDAELPVIVPMLSHFLLEKVFEQPDLLRLLYVAGFEVPGAERMVREHLGPIFDVIHGYFERCAAKGLIGDVEASMATLSLAGIVSAHQNLYHLFTGKKLEWKTEQSAPAYADFLLNALGHSGDDSPQAAES
jgi:AcrR family transcriptional regulator